MHESYGVINCNNASITNSMTIDRKFPTTTTTTTTTTTNTNNLYNVYGVVIIAYSNCKSSPGSFDECKLSAR